MKLWKPETYFLSLSIFSNTKTCPRLEVKNWNLPHHKALNMHSGVCHVGVKGGNHSPTLVHNTSNWQPGAGNYGAKTLPTFQPISGGLQEWAAQETDRCAFSSHAIPRAKQRAPSKASCCRPYGPIQSSLDLAPNPWKPGHIQHF